MKLYLLEQQVNNHYDTYDSMVVCAETPQEALRISPCNGEFREWDEELRSWVFVYSSGKRKPDWHGAWVNNLNDIKWTELGSADPIIKKGVVCASFNAG